MTVNKRVEVNIINDTSEPVAVVARRGCHDVPAEIVAQSIVELAEAVKRMQSTRLKNETIVTLLHAASGVGKREIRLILHNMAVLETTYLKPLKVTK